MAVDAQTMLLLTNGIAFVAAAFIFLEWKSLRERFLPGFALGFLAITIGCSLAPLRLSGSFVLGIWASNSMLPLAHLCFLQGAAAFAGRRLTRAWFLTPVLCSAMMALPGLDARTLSLINAVFVAVLSLHAAGLLQRERRAGGSGSRMLACTFAVHGGFYLVKSLCAFAPGAFIDLSRYAGTMIAISLFEGVLVEVALAMSIAAALRHRREDLATRLAESDPLTGLLNRRGFETRAKALLAGPPVRASGTLLLIDVDHFKTINDCFGHQEGDRLLVALADYLRLRSPADAIIGRLGGDEFAVALPQVGESAGLQLAQRLCAGFGQTAGPENCGTLSIGCAPFGFGARDLSEVQLQADRGLYDAKSKGRNRAGARPGSTSREQAGIHAPFPLRATG